MFVLILIAIIIAGIFSILLITLCSGFEWYNSLAEIMGTILLICTIITAISYCFVIWSWKAAQYKKQIINREYDTHYSREEIFFASDVIDIIKQLERNRIEINGNILREKTLTNK